MLPTKVLYSVYYKKKVLADLLKFQVWFSVIQEEVL